MPLAEMDPNLFHLDWDRLAEVLIAIIVLAFLVERALALFFENKHIVERASGKGVKEWIALALSFLICWRWDFDAVSMIILAEKTTILGELVTAAVIAGGSKASIKLFHDIMDMKSGSLRRYEVKLEEEAKAAKKPARKAPKAEGA